MGDSNTIFENAVASLLLGRKHAFDAARAKIQAAVSTGTPFLKAVLGVEPEERAAFVQGLPPEKRNELLEILDEAASCKEGAPVDFVKFHGQQKDAYLSSKKIQVLLGGNRSGKTSLGAIKMIQIAREKHPYYNGIMGWKPPFSFWCVTVSNSAHDETVIPAFRQWIPKSLVARWPTRDKNWLELRDGTKFVMKSEEQGEDKFTGAKIHGAWIDEEVKRKVFVETFFRTLDYKGFVMNTLTPLKGYTYLYHDYIAKKRSGELSDLVDDFQISMEENPHISKSEKDNLTRFYTDRELMSRKFGEFIDLTGDPFFDIEVLDVISKRVCDPAFGWSDLVKNSAVA